MQTESVFMEALPLLNLAVSRLSWTLASADYDSGDLRQDFALELLQRISGFDPARGSLARFVWVLTDHRVANIRDHEHAQQRDCRQNAWSVNEKVKSDDDEEERGANMAETACRYRSRPDAELLQLRLDVARVLDTLPPHLSRLARSLATEPVASAAQSAGVSRATAYRQVAEIRAAFAKAGLDRYLTPGLRPRCEHGAAAGAEGRAN